VKKTVKKVLAYIIRQGARGREVLVFDREESPESGTQVPAGTVDDGEELLSALFREIHEESGLQFTKIYHELGKFEWVHEGRNELHKRNVFQLDGAHLPNEWLHDVSGVGEDTGMQFRYFWLPVEKAETLLAADQGAYLRYLK
jgi:8-oxo-dGTP pyrophosphatase MutT (NUDIX family)